MAKILETVTRHADESVEAFKARCNNACLRERPELEDDKSVDYIGRFAMISDGRFDRRNQCLWGLAFPDLPAETCYILGIGRNEARGPIIDAEWASCRDPARNAYRTFLSASEKMDGSASTAEAFGYGIVALARHAEYREALRQPVPGYEHLNDEDLLSELNGGAR